VEHLKKGRPTSVYPRRFDFNGPAQVESLSNSLLEGLV
jgi:hypothetical protein